MFEIYFRRRPYLNMYGTCCSCISFCKSIVSQARANGFVSTNVLSDGDRRIGSSNWFILARLSALDDESASVETAEWKLNCGVDDRLRWFNNFLNNKFEDDDDGWISYSDDSLEISREDNGESSSSVNIPDISPPESWSTLSTGRWLTSLSEEDKSADGDLWIKWRAGGDDGRPCTVVHKNNDEIIETMNTARMSKNMIIRTRI